MWSVVTKVGQLLGLSRGEPQVDWDEVAAVLDADDETNASEEDDDAIDISDSSQVICQHRTGIVTELYDGHGYITNVATDGREESQPLYFNRKNSPDNLRVGNRVIYLAFRLSQDSEWVVRKVLYFNETWDDGDKEAEAEPLSTNVVTEECETAYKHVIAKVTGREGRTVLAGEVQFSLDSVHIDFIPVEGDWLSLSSLVQPQSEGDTVLMVERVSPLRSCTKEGLVSHWAPDSQLGIVDCEVVFAKAACEPGYLPRVGDKVTVYCIESEQGQLVWRAVNVVATVNREVDSKDSQLVPLMMNKHGIVISENTNFGTLTMGQEKQITIEISNNGDCTQILVAVEKSSQETQFLLPPLPFPLPVTIQPSDSLRVIAKVKGRFVGRSSVMLKFHFEEFEIGRQLFVDVQNASLASSLAENKSRGSSRAQAEPITGKKWLATRNGFIVPGVRPIKPANFVPVHLGMFTIPEKLVNLVLGSDKSVRKDEVIGQLLQEYRHIAEPLSGQNYIARWDLLIHIEELEHMANISRYDTKAALYRVDEYLSLEIPGLAERRPSLMVGDHVIARPSWAEEDTAATGGNSVGYEGFIHKVLSNEILLKFNPSFHDHCRGVYMITFQANRTAFRRLHQAVHVGYKNLTADWLFPSRISYQPPQVVIVAEENYLYPNSVENSKTEQVDTTNSNEILKIESDVAADHTENIALDTGDSGTDMSVNGKSISSGQQLCDVLNSSSDIINNGDASKCNKPKSKRQKSKVSDMFEKTSQAENNCHKVSPPRVSVVERLLQNGNCHSTEKSPKEVESVLKQFMSLSCATPKNNTGMKTLEEIEKTLLTPHKNDVTDGIKPLSEGKRNILVDENEKSLMESSNTAKKQKPTQGIQQNRSNKHQKEKNNKITKNSVNESRKQNQRDEINWNSNIQMKLGNEKEGDLKIPSWKKTKIRWFNPLLNHYQKEAVRNILRGEARPLPYVIFGPPGTGKTITVVEAVLQIYFLIPESRLLIATPSNSAADLVCNRLLSCGLLAAGDLLRLCSFHYADQGRVAESLRPYCGTADIKARDDLNAPSHLQEGVVNISRNAIGRHRVTVGTCGSLAVLYQMGFPKGHFTHVVVDEAGQATEPEILVPLVFLHKSYGQAILAGDPLQLGPVVMSSVAEHFGLGESFLSRLLQRSAYSRDLVGHPTTGGYNPHLVTRLVYNYRSLPEILALPNSMFYDGDLVPKISDVSSEEVDILCKLETLLPIRPGRSPPPLVFHGVRGTNCQAAESPSWFNPHEVVQTTLYLQSLYNAGLTPDHCGIITPYQAQAHKIRTMLATLEIDAPKVGSVEEFQGQERMVVILSTVRSSPRLVETDLRHSVGFVASPRRLNVAITRARACLIVLGNPHLLARDHYWRTVLQYCVNNGGYMGCDLPPELSVGAQ